MPENYDASSNDDNTQNKDAKDPEEDFSSGSSYNESSSDEPSEDVEDRDTDNDEKSKGAEELEGKAKDNVKPSVVITTGSNVYQNLRFALTKNLDEPQEEKQAASVRQEFDKQQEKSREETQQLKIENKGRSDYFQLRVKWSWFLLVTLSVMVLFQIFLTVAIGVGWLHYERYKPFLELLVGETFLQVAGMCYIVVRCLFPGEKGDKKDTKKSE